MKTLKEGFNQIAVKQGEEFAVELRNVASTGYCWDVKTAGDVTPLGRGLAEPFDYQKHGCGGGPAEVFKFKASKVGDTTIEATCSRPWAPSEDDHKIVFKVSVS
jgi:predicted secreted protein